MALFVHTQTTAAPWEQVSRTGEGAPREEEHRAGDGVGQLVDKGGRVNERNDVSPNLRKRH